MKRWHIGSLLLVAAGSLALATGGTFAGDKGKKAPEIPPREGKSETIKLFNGKDLDGWEGYMDLWSVKDGVIVAHNDKPLKYSTYLFTKRSFSDFRLVFSAKLVESKTQVHTGVALWGKKFLPPGVKDAVAEKAEYTYQGHLVMFPKGWGLYDLYRRNGLALPKEAIQAEYAAGKQTDWNDMEVLAQGNRIRFVLNGKLVVDWRDPEPKNVAEGPIALQLHSNGPPQEIHFKGLEVTTFPEDKLVTVK
jgi:hypothetical protein